MPERLTVRSGVPKSAAMVDAVCTTFPQVTSRKSAYPCSYASSGSHGGGEVATILNSRPASALVHPGNLCRGQEPAGRVPEKPRALRCYLLRIAGDARATTIPRFTFWRAFAEVVFSHCRLLRTSPFRPSAKLNFVFTEF